MDIKIASIDTCTIINFYHIDRIWILDHLKYSLFTTIFVILEIRKFKEEQIRRYLERQLRDKRIMHIELDIEDLIEMASIPESKRVSNAELSCIIKAKRMNCMVITDDNKAVRYVKKFFDVGKVIGIRDILIEAYLFQIIDDNEIKLIQEILKKNRFNIKEDLCFEAARRRYLIKNSSIRSG